MRWAGSVLTLMAAVALGMAPAAAAAPPEITGATIVGDPSIVENPPVVGATLSVAATVVGEPAPAVTYDWRRGCTAEECVQVGTAPTYVVAPADAGAVVFVRVTATNPSGTTMTDWLETKEVHERPAVTGVTIDGTAMVGETLSAQATATGFPAPALSYEWRRCAAAGTAPEDCQPVHAGSAYVVEGADRGGVLFVRATASNAAGTAVGDSARTTAVQERPQVTSVTIAGRAVVGEKLTANATATGTPAPGLTYEWLRCAALLPPACEPIEDATAKAYVVASADAGDRLAVRVRAANSAGADTAVSQPTDVVPEPERFNQSGTTPTASTKDPSAPSSTSSPPVTSTGLRYLRPFPVVRVKGFLVPGGARFSLVHVKAPRRSKVTVRCRNYACPVSRRPLRVGRIRALERFLPAGARITIRVRKPGLIGKYVRVLIRDGSAPKRRDACLLPGKTRPVACPPA